MYQGPVRSEEEVRRNLESIGPEIVQTLSVSNKRCQSSRKIFASLRNECLIVSLDAAKSRIMTWAQH